MYYRDNNILFYHKITTVSSQKFEVYLTLLLIFFILFIESLWSFTCILWKDISSSKYNFSVIARSSSLSLWFIAVVLGLSPVNRPLGSTRTIGSSPILPGPIGESRLPEVELGCLGADAGLPWLEQGPPAKTDKVKMNGEICVLVFI